MRNQDVYKKVSETILNIMEENKDGNWIKPWFAKQVAPKSLATGKYYRGTNYFLLTLMSWNKGYESPYWATFNQIKKRGGKVKKGEKATPIIFWQNRVIEVAPVDENEEPELKQIPLLRYYFVFNLEQTDLVIGENIEAPVNQIKDFENEEAIQMILDGMENCPEILHRGGRAFYRPSTDKITMPAKTKFESEEHYYRTLIHELGHSVCNERRLGCPFNGDKLQKQSYATEELVVEMASAFVCAIIGVNNYRSEEDMKNHAMYIKSWSARIKGDPRWIVKVSTWSQKVADYLLSGITSLQSE